MEAAVGPALIRDGGEEQLVKVQDLLARQGVVVAYRTAVAMRSSA